MIYSEKPNFNPILPSLSTGNQVLKIYYRHHQPSCSLPHLFPGGYIAYFIRFISPDQPGQTIEAGKQIHGLSYCKACQTGESNKSHQKTENTRFPDKVYHFQNNK